MVNAKLEEAKNLCSQLPTSRPRELAVLHVAAALQRSQFAAGIKAQSKKATFMFFDRLDGSEERRVAAHISNPPVWIKDFLHDKSDNEGLSAIVDTAYFVDSKQAPLIQIADFLAFMIQRKAVLDLGESESFVGEAEVLADVFGVLGDLLIQKSSRLPTLPTKPIFSALKLLSPESLL